ncbi:acetyl/propionyl-CoA carboxylase subuit alpha [Brachybacterium sp. P6-10-X1]|uniref:acetyl/propionyl/methylcrotonyl-CoA carboxylase subunit alpha n=1 Tax=Brachybacterium sp. P6-10-X1 TaxID=1903186 RepID=UPI0009719770|nr:biotin carboxylase N-terminal domain-containing protein [Brachybacterium sp. P6-10-X1]APX33574.1 acetyl/propionyl-CoA carboxylase subuit alpha [Brachybacterium sp. P6-10-X1]
MLSSVLIAHRGEIAMRILRTVHDLGLTAIAVHTDEDSGAVHVAAADAAIRIGSYLDGEQIIAAATASGAEAVHPGYGFLSERADFARACARAGLVFIGPDAAAIGTMGDKISARAAVAARGVATVPGLAEPGLDDAALIAGAADVGFPLLVKPAAGGGGKGMHRVADPDQLPSALDTARREAAGAFGDDTLFLERWITSPRHIEVQILADAHGTVVHLGERECSLQRRHQKVIEEAPSPSLTPAQRERFGQAAIAAARAVRYRGAGTVEFIVDAAAPEQPFFLEMNTRLQVEHAVTEAVTGYDLVAEQIRIADGQPLSIRQDEVRASGHAIEARVYAEDPDAGFLPTGGTVLDLALPEGVRVDHALAVGTTVSSSYDPMLAKVIAHAPTREQAVASLDRALASTHVLGVVTNTAFLRALLALDEVVAGTVDTGLVQRRLDELTRPPPGPRTLAVAALVRWDRIARSRPDDLWHAPTGWRLGAQAPFTVRFDAADGAGEPGAVPRTVELTGSPAAARARIDGEEIALTLHPGAVTVDGIRLPLIRHGTETAVWIGLPGEDRELILHSPRRSVGVRDAAPALESPMPGTVTAVLAAEGAEVAAGDPVLVVEAMKMEHTLSAPSAGTVRLRVAVGDRVARGAELAQVITEQTVPDESLPDETVPDRTRRPDDEP